MNIQQAIAQLLNQQELTQSEAEAVMDQIMSGAATDAQIGAYLVAMRMKGESVAEITGSALAMRSKALTLAISGRVVDTCGTGGDGAGTFNISTTAAFLVAAQGVIVAKHGNRALSSKSGSADLLAALGVNIEASPEVVERCLHEVGIGFLFAPKHHSAMRHVAGPRRELGVRTLFNLLGPLTNPASAPYQLLGLFSRQWLHPIASVLGRLGVQHALVVHGEDGLDEITTTTITHVAELLEDGSVRSYTLDPRDFALPLARPEQLLGGDAASNAALTRRILQGEQGPARDIVLLNAGAALYAARRAASIAEGLQMAAEAVDSGQAAAVLQRLIACSQQR
ncbi:anthranilate phosphoribosyltransferase [Candidatus Magnetaquicoccus inordinatus]|uniref:anthranilate phosphoribosyltransferase n=1 Tax=Candidatus Magnetaquicoccus inordinatus TaxID=2496818 RepID=UPI00102B3732|nr:anthranilate phosphoribosyltransferase [Candidatus Magnetaquicoccus inordinatus]